MAVVVGGGSGIGAATAVRLTELGASVAIFDIDVARAMDVAERVSPRELCTVHEVDVSDEERLGAAVSAVLQRI